MTQEELNLKLDLEYERYVRCQKFYIKSWFVKILVAVVLSLVLAFQHKYLGAAISISYAAFSTILFMFILRKSDV